MVTLSYEPMLAWRLSAHAPTGTGQGV
jgi:hypothetical protein